MYARPQRHMGAGTGDPFPVRSAPPAPVVAHGAALGVKPLTRPGNLPARTRQLTSQACRRDISTVHEHSSSRRRRMSVGTGTLALSLGLCLCAGQLVATPAASAAPVTAAAASKVKPKV